jgi:hypothetical protein
MNSPASSQPALKVVRNTLVPESSVSGLTEVRNDLGGQLAADLEALREQEENLRKYEVRLREWQAQLDATVAAGGSASPFMRTTSASPFPGGPVDPALEAAWAKFHRARALLEAEQNQLRDDRLALRDLEQRLKEREAELAAREAQLAQREADAATNACAPSAVQRLTQAPFLAAKAVFRVSR